MLAMESVSVDNNTLMAYASFRTFRAPDNQEEAGEAPEPPALSHATLTPDEILRATHRGLEEA